MPVDGADCSTAPDALQARIVAALREPGVLSEERTPALIETHISYVLLTGRFAYKIKKAVRLPFLDFRTLDARRRYCEEELRLNRRFTPDLYLDVVAITGDADRPVPGGHGPALEYAVRMREFPQDALLSAVCDRGELDGLGVDALAERVARFHGEAAVAPPDSPFGDPQRDLDDALANFEALAPLAERPSSRDRLDALRAWTLREHVAIRARLADRRVHGFVRECHGDLHLGNVALVAGAVVPFDCIEFDPHMRWIDVAGDVAFTAMDLRDRGRPDLAHRFMDAYLLRTGDYGMVALQPFLQAYRAMVRAKVAALRAAQASGTVRAIARADALDRLALASALSAPRPRALVVAHGLAGCGKTTLTQSLLEETGAVRVRTDVERKRLAGLGALDRSGSAIAGGLYSADATRAAYAHVLACATEAIEGGAPVLVDGTFLARWQRDLFRERAAALGVPFALLAIETPAYVLRERVARRQRSASDASEAGVEVLDLQLAIQEPLRDDERRVAIVLDGTRPPALQADTPGWRALVARLAPSPREDVDEAARAHAASLRIVAFLSRPASHPDGVSNVERIETHQSWVLLTDRHAYKVKKRMRTPYADLRTLAARRRSAFEEVRLNRRLTDDVYLGATPLLEDADGRLAFDRGDDVADWVVRMRRLPRERMLDRLLARGVAACDLDALVSRLCGMYRAAAVSAQSPQQYRDDFATGIELNRKALAEPAHRLEGALIEDVCARQLAALARAELFDARVAQRRVVEVHGDLRPEHVCLDGIPQVIDALDFSRPLRMQDAADEIGFLALECERLGAPLRDVLLAAYRKHADDSPPDELVHFYQSYRAAVRARLAILHLREPVLPRSDAWRALATRYLELARLHVERC